MESFTYSELEWHDILGCLPLLVNPTIREEVVGPLVDRVVAMRSGDPDALLTLELDDASSVAVHRARHMCLSAELPSEEAMAAIAEAEAIIREHQQRT
jgi:hypothetical protein